jgi:hypothetical protein
MIIIIIIAVVCIVILAIILAIQESFSLNPVLDASISAPMWNLAALNTLSPNRQPTINLETVITGVIKEKLRVSYPGVAFMNYDNISAVPNGAASILVIADFWMHEPKSATTHRMIMQMQYEYNTGAINVMSCRPATRRGDSTV